MTEGYVVSVTERPGEGGLSIVTARLTSELSSSEDWEILLAPRAVLSQIGFEVEAGDHLKARGFPTAEGPLKVHKVLNLTRRKMVRLRTLSQTPLWDGAGTWQGGACQGVQGTGQTSGGGPLDLFD